MNKQLHHLCVLCVLSGCIVSGSALAQSAQVPAPPQQRTIIIENATIHVSPSETIPSPGYIIFENGIITQFGEGEAPDIENAERFEAEGLHVYPGLIATDTQLGLTEIGAVDVTQDVRELGDFTPEVRSVLAVNPDSDLIPVTRANGVMVAATFPSGGIVSGRGAIIRLDGWTWEQMAIEPEAGLVVNWPRTDPINAPWMRTNPEEQRRRASENLEKIDRFFDDARTYFEAKDADPNLPIDLRFEGMRAALSGQQPVFIRANSASQIESSVAWAVARNLRPVIVGGTEAHDAIPILKKHNVPVIIAGTHRMPGRTHDAYDSAFTLPAKLHEAGVRVAISSGEETAHERSLPYAAATAAAYGLPKEVALASVTSSAAEILGIADRYGSLDTGKSATLIVTTGDPLEITSDTVLAFIDGRSLDLGSRHKRLYEKYLEKYRQVGAIE
jgi:imidazolonepropionase-like amidohydrolase